SGGHRPLRTKCELFQRAEPEHTWLFRHGCDLVQSGGMSASLDDRTAFPSKVDCRISHWRKFVRSCRNDFRPALALSRQSEQARGGELRSVAEAAQLC